MTITRAIWESSVCSLKLVRNSSNWGIYRILSNLDSCYRGSGGFRHAPTACESLCDNLMTSMSNCEKISVSSEDYSNSCAAILGPAHSVRKVVRNSVSACSCEFLENCGSSR